MNGELGVYLGIASIILGVISQAAAIQHPGDSLNFIVGACFIAAGIVIILNATGAW